MPKVQIHVKVGPNHIRDKGLTDKPSGSQLNDARAKALTDYGPNPDSLRGIRGRFADWRPK